jgi:hypothetical protein
MRKIFQTKNIVINSKSTKLFTNFLFSKNIHVTSQYTLYNQQSKSFAERSIFTRFLDLRKKLDGISYVSKTNDKKTFNKKDLEEAENIFQAVIDSKDKTKITEMISEIKTILSILSKNKIYSRPIQEIVYSIFKELQGTDFPFFLVPEYISYLLNFEKKSSIYFPPNFVSDFEKHFYEKAIMLKVRELSLFFSLNKILNNQISSNFIPFLEKIILLNINDEKFLYLKSCELIMSDLRRYSLIYASNKFLDEYLSVYLKMISVNSINHKELNFLLRSLNKRIKTNYFDFELREILHKFFEGSKELIQNQIDDETFYDQDLLFAFLLIAKNNFLTGIFSKNYYNSIVKKIITKDVNRLTMVNLLNFINELPMISSSNIEKVDLHLVHTLKQFKELRDFFLTLKYAKKYNNHVLVDIVFLQLSKYLLEKGDLDYNFLYAINSFKQTYKFSTSINRFSLNVLDAYIKRNPKKVNMSEEKVEQNEIANENMEEKNLKE